jgi:hypothetical protein
MRSTTQARAVHASLRARGIVSDPRQFEKLLREAIEAFPQVALVDPRTELSERGINVLESGGFDLSPRDLGEGDPIARAAAQLAALANASFTAKEAAELLRVDRTRIFQRLNTNRRPSLYGFRWHGEWRLPTFQFEGEQILPNFDKIMAVLPRDLHPLSVYRWFTTPTPDLRDRNLGRDVSPREWLLLGNDPAPVVHIAEHL